MNISRYLSEGHGRNIIQGSLSLDDEDVNGCTEIIPGFQTKIRQWWDKVGERGKIPDGVVHEVRDIYTKDDERAFGEYQPVPCLRGWTRITMLEILHGSTQNGSSKIRRTIFLWFVRVSDDGLSVDNEESIK